MIRSEAIWSIDDAAYVAHPLHRSDHVWTEANCYVDLWIELLHVMQLDPVAGLAFTLAMDFEEDQWTFFKFPLGDLLLLYGIDVQELNIWQPLLRHVSTQVARGRPVLMEVDLYFLPNVAGTGYQTHHQKTTIGVQSIAVEARQLGYFHHGGYYQLQGADFDGIFHGYPTAGQETALPLYVEIARLDQMKRRSPAELADLALDLTRLHLAHRPDTNPFARYRRQFPEDLAWLRQCDLATFHEYAYATLRQSGACFYYAAIFLRWLAQHGHSGPVQAAAELEFIADVCRTLMLKTARAVGSGKAIDCDPLLRSMEASWDVAMGYLDAGIGGGPSSALQKP